MVFDTTLHLATATSLIVFFYKDLVELARALVGDLVKNNFRFKNYSPKSLTGLAIVVGCIPAGVLGFFAGYVTSRGVVPFLGMEIASALPLDPIMVLFAWILAVAVGVAASIYPAYKAAQLDPSLALKAI